MRIHGYGLHALDGALLADMATATVNYAGIVMSQANAWGELKRDYPQLYRHELADVEEGRRAGAYGFNPGSVWL